jgi:hypothetical protein
MLEVGIETLLRIQFRAVAGQVEEFDPWALPVNPTVK